MTTQPAKNATVTDIVTTRANRGEQPYYFESVSEALEFVVSELNDIRALTATDGLQGDSSPHSVRLARCAALTQECLKLHNDWQAQNPNPKEQQS